MLLLYRRSSIFFVSLYITFAIAPNPEGWQLSSRSDAPEIGMACKGNFPEEYIQGSFSDPNQNPFAGFLHAPYYQNLIHLCARQDWGGREVNAGGRCSALTEDPFTILFDYRGYREVSFIRDYKVALYCYSKCWCTGGRSGNVPLLGRVPLTLPVTTISHVLDPWDGQVIPDAEITPDDPFLPILFLVESSSQEMSLPQYTAFRIQYTGMPEGRIKCEGDIPTFPIPRPEGTFYNSLLEFCAAGIYGGNSRGSAGGFCDFKSQSGHGYRQMGLLSHGSIGVFLTEVPARTVEYIYLAVTFAYCSTHCYCDPKPEDLDVERQTVTLPGQSQGIKATRNGNDFNVHFGSFGMDVLSRSLGQNHIKFIPAVKRKRPAQPKHHRVYTVQINPDLSEPPNQQQQCPLTRTCRKSADCNSCVCQVSGMKGIVDPLTRKLVFSEATCGYWISPALAMMASLFNRKSSYLPRLFGAAVLSGGELLGRAVGPTEREEDTQAGPEISPTWCACNASYVSVGCCQTADGLTWEEPELQLGWLA